MANLAGAGREMSARFEAALRGDSKGGGTGEGRAGAGAKISGFRAAKRGRGKRGKGPDVRFRARRETQALMVYLEEETARGATDGSRGCTLLRPFLQQEPCFFFCRG